MFRKILAIVLIALFVSAPVLANPPDGETVITATGGFRLASLNAAGPRLLEALADGTATIILVDSLDGEGSNPNTARRFWPSGEAYGNANFALRANIPRPFVTQGASVDSVFVVLTTATEIVLTWTN